MGMEEDAKVLGKMRNDLEGLPLVGRFYMPGHKGRLSRIDVTELYGMDDLRDARGIIAEAQRDFAERAGAGRTWFLTEGSSLGIQAMIAAICLEKKSMGGFGGIECGEKVDVLGCAGDCFGKADMRVGSGAAAADGWGLRRWVRVLCDEYRHVALENAAFLLGVELIDIPRDIDKVWNIPKGLEAVDVEVKLKEGRVDAVFITSPNYYGVCSDIAGIAEVCRRFGVLLLVDGAHGAHFGLHGGLPKKAVQLGADFCVESVHKTLPALTQTAVLHGRVAVEESFASEMNKKVQVALNIFQTTSPSYLLMNSIAEAHLLITENAYDELIERCLEFRRRVECFENDDVTRLVFKGSERELREVHGVWAEKEDGFGNVILMPTVCNGAEDWEQLISDK